MSEKNNVKTGNTGQKNGLLSFLKEVKGEFKIITWPSKNETKKALVAILIFTLIYVMLVGGLDFIFKSLFKMILNLK
jgi:preprotein translocase subunit SecE